MTNTDHIETSPSDLLNQFLNIIGSKPFTVTLKRTRKFKRKGARARGDRGDGRGDLEFFGCVAVGHESHYPD